MPGESTNMMGDYSMAELSAMSLVEFEQAKKRGFSKPLIAAPGEERPAAAGIAVGSSVPTPVAQPAAGNVWARNRAGGKDFVCPSGQTCKLRPISIEALMMEGVLDKVTRLEGLAQILIDKAEGAPPAKQVMPSREDLEELLNLVNVIVPLAVAEPRVYRDDDPNAPADAIRVSDIELDDRIAILNQAMSGLQKLDRFRNAG
jgi:hypothetical protein